MLFVNLSQAFLHGLSQCGRKWARIADIVKTRTPDQVRSHAQKHFIKVFSSYYENYLYMNFF